MHGKIYHPIVMAAVLLLCLIAAGSGMAQTPTLQQKQEMEKPKPDHLLEKQQLNPAPRAGSTPPGPVHCCAEWEESEGIITLWKKADLVNELQKDHQVYIPVDDQAQEDKWIVFLINNGIPPTNIHFLHIMTDTIWTRDYGPWFIWDANNMMGIVNYTCHSGYWDDLFPYHFAEEFRIKYYESGLYHVGGNYYPNGYGRAFSSTHVYQWNPSKTKAEVDAAMLAFYGIENYHTVAPKDIWHHDTWGKPANPETLVIVDFPEDDIIRHAQADGMVACYATLESPWGRPYKILRLPMFPKTPGSTTYRPYMNSLISNKQVFVPIHDCPDDAIALSVLQAAFVGYDLVGVIAKECEWRDAIHCRTRNFVKREQIRMYPYPPGDTEETGAGYPVKAEVIPPNGATLLAGYPVILWTATGGEPFLDVVMTPTGQPNEYTADIPAQSLDTTVSFYIEARDDGGLEAIYPMVAPDGMMSFKVRADTEAPVLSRLVPSRSASAGQWPPLIRTLCKDDMATPEVYVEYSINGVPQADVSLTREALCYWYSGTLEGTAYAGDVVSYRVHATDSAASPNNATMPPLGKYFCPLSGPGSVAVVNLCGRPYTAPFLLDALGDLGVPHHYYSSWPTDWSEHDVWFICLGVFADNYVLSAGEANDIVSALQNGKHIYLEGGNTWSDDPEKDTLGAVFSVKGLINWESMNQVTGIAGSLMDGLDLKYVGEDLQMDVIKPLSPAEKLFECTGGKCRTVIYDAGGYRTVASTFALGGLLDGDWPSTRKEILVRYLEFFGVKVDLYTGMEARMAQPLSLNIKGASGEIYLLLGSLAENHVKTGYGTFRLDQDYLFYFWHGVIPSSGIEELSLYIPQIPEYAGFEVHLQAVKGKALTPSQSKLTNREILTLIE
ncbi:MAG: agmatine deiminase family protein [Planctomycetota bacterium]